MNDCRNAEIRDQLPDLLHDRLSDGARASVLAHVDGCAECRDELELLRGIHHAMTRATPRVDVGRIVSALPKSGASVVIPMQPTRASRSRWADWRIAAAITVFAVGGTSLALLQRTGGAGQAVAIAPPLPAIVSDTPAPPRSPQQHLRVSDSTGPAPGSQTVTPPATRVANAESSVAAARNVSSSADDAPEIGMEGRLTGLNDQQLRTLLDDIGQLKATPITEPDPVTIKVDSRSTRGPGDTEFK